jgi:hypothetical protein
MSQLRTINIQIIEAIDPDVADYRVQVHICRDGKEVMLLKADHPASMQANSLEPLEACKSIFQWFANNPQL